VASIAHSSLHQVVLGHLSEDCNHPEKAVSFIRDALEGLVTHDVQVWCADRKNASETREVACRRLLGLAPGNGVPTTNALVGGLA